MQFKPLQGCLLLHGSFFVMADQKQVERRDVGGVLLIRSCLPEHWKFQGIVPELTESEKAKLEKEREDGKTNSTKIPSAPEFPLADRVKELGLDGTRQKFKKMGRKC